MAVFPTGYPELTLNRNDYLYGDDGTKGGKMTVAEILGQAQATDITGLAAVALSGSYNDLSNKPVLNFAPLASPAFTGTPTAPTPTTGDNSTKIATTAFVTAAVPSIATTSKPGLIQPDGITTQVQSGVLVAQGIVPPVAASIAGYSQLVFHDEFDNANTIAPTSVKNVTVNSAFKGGNISTNSLPTKVSFVGSPSYGTLIGTGYVNGVPYMDINWTATGLSSGYNLGVYLCDYSASASNGQVFTSSVSIQLIAGAMTNLSNAKTEMTSVDSGYANGTSFDQTFTPTSTNTATHVTGTMPSNAAHVNYAWLMQGTGNINVTLRFSQLQIELGSSVTSYQETPLTGYNWYQYSSPIPSSGYSVANSVLTITNDTTGDGNAFQSVFTYNDTIPNRGVFNHGYFEARMQFNPGGWQGGSNAWPAFWSRSLLLTQTGYGSELDFMEYYASGSNYPTSPPLYATTLHEWANGSNTQNANNQPGNLIDGNWHTYGCLWSPGQVTWYFDNVAVEQVSCGPGTSYPSLELMPIYLIIGGGQGWPVSFDWVRVWGPGEKIVTLTTQSTYFVLPTDETIIVRKTSGSATTIVFPSNVQSGRKLTIKDGKGDCTTNAITCVPAAGKIDGSSSYVINTTAYQSQDFRYDGVQWNRI